MEGAMIMGFQQEQLGRQEGGVGSSLTLQLQQVILQHQQKQQQQQQQLEPHLDHPQQQEHEQEATAAAAPMEFGEADPLKDPVFNYISDIVMDDDPYDDQRTCMFIDCSGYQAMAKELTELISDPSSSESSEGKYIEPQEQTKNAELWVDGLFKTDSPLTVDSSAVTVNIDASEEEEVFIGKLNGFLGEMQNDIEKRTKASPSSSRGGIPLVTSTKKKKKQVEEVDLCKLLVECAEALAEQQLVEDVNGGDCLWWSSDLSKELFVSGTIRDVQIDGKAVETEKALKAELHKLLLECAQAVGADEMTKAYQMVNYIRDRVSPRGSGTERIVFHFAEALVARITGTGALLYSALVSNKPPFAEMLKAHRLITRYLPNIRICHYFLNQTILNLTEGASRIHIVDYGILYGFQWPCLMKALAAREGGPPHLRITGIDFPQPGFKPAERVEETGRKLAEYAKQVGVPFEYHALATAKWEAVQPSSLVLRHDEVLIVNSMFRLRHLLDESVMVDSPRKLVLSRIRSMRPKVFIQSVVSTNYNAPFFLARFREALQHYSSVFDAIDTAMPECPERHLIEQSIMGREILNVIACEGVERVERAESYRQWQSRTQKAGFEQLPLSPDISSKSRAMMGTYHKNFGIGQDGNWLLLGWKERVLHAMTTWKVAGSPS